MKQKLLSVMIALIAITIPSLSYAQSQEAAGTYFGKLNVFLLGIPAGGNEENVYITAEDENHITLEIKDFKFLVGGTNIEIGDIRIPGVEVQKEGNTISILPADVVLTLPDPIKSVDVHLNKSTIVDKRLDLTLTVNTIYPQAITVNVEFDGTYTEGSGIQDVSSSKPSIFYNNETNMLTVKGAQNMKYDIYNTSGLHVVSGILNSEVINVSNLSKGLYLIKIDNYTTKFIKR